MEEWVWYEKIGRVIQERTFDLSADKNDWPTIHWMIARHMLEGYSEYEVHLRLEYFADKIGRNFNHAINRLLEEGTNVYIIKHEGDRNITAVTTDPDYMDAEARDARRVISNMQKHITSNTKRMEQVNPEIGSKIKRRTSNLVIFLEEQKSLPFDDGEEAEA